MSNERQRKTIPILGTDTSTSDQQVKDGSMQALHNLRYSGGSWRDIKPFKEIVSVSRGLKPNRISVDYNGNVTAEHRVESDITVTATWWDVDGIESSETSGVIRAGESTAEIPVAQEMLGAVRVHPESDDVYIYYAEGSISSSEDTTVRIIYQHPADDNDVYIVTADNEDNSKRIMRVRIQGGKYTILETIHESIAGQFSVSHFGKILFFITENGNIQYRLTGNRYVDFSTPEPPIIHTTPKLSLTGYDSDRQRTPVNKIVKLQEVDLPFWGHLYDAHHPFYNIDDNIFSFPRFSVDGGIWGEFCFFAIFQTSDGQLICPSALSLAASEPYYHGAQAVQYTPQNAGMGDYQTMRAPRFMIRKHNDKYYVSLTGLEDETSEFKEKHIYPFSFLINPYIEIEIPEGVDTDVVEFVNIYSTRVNDIWDLEKFKVWSYAQRDLDKTTEGNVVYKEDSQIVDGFQNFYSDEEIQKQPFYLMKSIPIKDFKNNRYSMWITAKEMELIEQKKQYDPVDAHTLIFSKTFEMNSRLHVYGDIKYALNKGFGRDYFGRKGNDFATIKSLVQIDENIHEVNQGAFADIAGSTITNKILSYFDYRGVSIIDSQKEFTLTSVINNNLSYHVNKNDHGNLQDFNADDITYENKVIQYVKYSSVFEGRDPEAYDEVLGDVVSAPNGSIKVSAVNNPLVWPLANTYAIGTRDNKILAINSGAIEMSDAKFGEFPLYVFTEEGIFALQSGSGEILYSSTIPLNYDRIINPNTLAVNYNVLYITSRGLHALYSNGTSLLSEAVNDKNNEPNIEFWEGAQLAYQPKYSEVIIFNNKKDYLGHYRYTRAYVFSLSNKTWSTRDWIPFINYDGEGAYLIGTDKLVDHSATMISLLDINEEVRTEGATHCSLVSRPIKFESMEFKRIESLIPRIEVSQKTPVHVSVWASTNLVDWFPLREASGDIDNKTMAIRRTPMSARYFRIELSANVEKDIAIDSFDVEYYFRFLHRMR